MNLEEYKKLAAKDIDARKKRKADERALQITSKQWFDFSLPNVLAFHIPNGSYFGKDRQAAIIQMALLKKMGFLPGAPDWILTWPEGKGALELKFADGRLSENQIKFKDRWIKSGGLYGVCRSMEEIEAAVKSWNLKPLYKTPPTNEGGGKYMRQFAYFDAMRPID